MKFSYTPLICLSLVLFLGACGIKPSTVELPEGQTSDYPRTYPDPSTDPKP